VSHPKSLSKVDPALARQEIPAIDRARFCPTCKQEARIVSNSSGIEAYCGPCHKHWPISCMPMVTVIAATFPRGLSKQTLVEPDWNRADEDQQGDPLNEQIGPRRR